MRNLDIIRTRGGVLVNGQFHELPKTPAGPNYQHVGSDIARKSMRDKRSYTQPVEVAHGMRSRIKPGLSPHIHGIAVDDEPPAVKPSLSGDKQVPTHPGMATHLRTAHERAAIMQGSPKLKSASTLGRDDLDDTSHIEHKVSKGASLPASPRGARAQIMQRTDRRK